MSRLLDTSLLVRYLTGDPSVMADAIARIIDAEPDLLISDVALVEDRVRTDNRVRGPTEVGR